MIRALLVEDSDIDARVIACEVRDVATVEVALDKAMFLTKITQPFDVVLVDLDLVNWRGTEAIEIVKERYPATPVIIVTGSVSRRQADAACKHGARRFFTKELDGVPGLAMAVVDEHEAAKTKAEADELKRQTYLGQRNAMLAELLIGLGHDQANYLQLILGGADHLRTRINPMDEFILDKMRSATLHCAELMKQCVAFARGVNGGEYQELTADYILTELGILLRGSFPKNIKIDIRITPGTAKLRGNKTQLQEVLVNLCVNSLHALPKGGNLTIEATNAALRDEPVGDFVRFSVTDTGHGIPASILPRVWDIYFTTKGSKGNGIGLSQVRHIVTAHGGKVDVQSVPGNTVFSFYIPVSSKRTTPAKPKIDGGGRVVLYVDDEEGLRFLVPVQLEQANFKVLVAGNGIEALSKFRSDIPVDLLLTDVGMSLMDGPQLADALHSQGFNVPVVYVTGHDTQMLPENAAVLKKPFTAEELFKACAKALGFPDESSSV